MECNEGLHICPTFFWRDPLTITNSPHKVQKYSLFKYLLPPLPYARQLHIPYIDKCYSNSRQFALFCLIEFRFLLKIKCNFTNVLC